MMFDYSRARIRARLIDDVRQAYRFWSVRIAVIGAAVSAAWAALPPDTRTMIPGAHWIGLALFIATALARILHQPDLRP